MRLRISPSQISGVVSAPPSKSYTHRAVILASLADGESIIEDPLLSDDTIYTIEACRLFGADISQDGNRLKITGTGGKVRATERGWVFVGNSGSTIRMVAPIAVLGQGSVVFDGDYRLRQRPVGELLSALRSLGVRAYSLKSNGCPPIEVQGGGISGGEVKISGRVSSQHISSLLMVAPYTRDGIRIKVIGKLRSRPYIDITIDIMRAFGVEVINQSYKDFWVKGGQAYRGRRYRIEGDYSSAAYFFAAAAIGGQPVTVTNLKRDSVQGDRNFLNILESMGCSIESQDRETKIWRNKKLTAVNLDMGDYPDIVPTLAVVAAYASGKTEIANISHLRFKESDRISNIATELRRMGIKADVSDNAITIYGGKPKGAEIEVHADHRMVMSFAIGALFAQGSSTINGAEAVNKSYPRFFADLKRLGARIEELL